MGMGVAIFLIALGAILKWAVTASTDGIDLQMVGTILMIVGAVGALMSLMFWNTWGGFSNRRGTRL